MNYIGQSLIAMEERCVRLKWQISSSADLEGYYIYMSEQDNQHFKRIVVDPIRDSEWVSGPLRTDMDYFFYISAVDTSGNESAPSSIVEFMFDSTIVDSNLTIIEIRNPLLHANEIDTTSIITNDFLTSFILGGL